MTNLNLLADAVFPVRMANGAGKWLSYAQLFESPGLDGGDDFPIDFDWPRPDMNIATWELVIGIMAVAMPLGEDAWPEAWQEGVQADVLAGALAPLVPAFNLVIDGDQPGFMQSFEALDPQKSNPIEALFIDTPGESTRKKNIDLLTHRNRVTRLGLPAAAIALYAMQQFAPSGGAGNRTSMRGGGPLTALAMAKGDDDSPAPIWRTILLNQPQAQSNLPDVPDLGRLFPWTVPTLLSDKANGGQDVHQSDQRVDPLQCFFGMPRRIRLVVMDDPGECDLTNTTGPVVTGFLQEPWGTNYGIWQHPMTPYRRQKEGSEPYSVKPKTGRFGYREWAGIALAQTDTQLATQPQTLGMVSDRSMFDVSPAPRADLRVAGWAMNNMEAVTYLFADQPLYLAQNSAGQAQLRMLAKAMVDGGGEANGILRGAIRNANFDPGATVDTGGALFVNLRSSFFGTTERQFHMLMAQALAALGVGGQVDIDASTLAWQQHLRDVALALFERDACDPMAGEKVAMRRNEAESKLRSAMSGYGPAGKRLFTAMGMSLPVPVTAKAKHATKARSSSKKAEGANV